MSKTIRLLLTGSLLLALSGCWGVDVNAVGAGPWPVYDEPTVEFTPEEATQLEAWKAQNKTLFKKIQGQDNAWRAIVREHNKRARDLNRKKLEMLGFKQVDLDKLQDK